MKLICRSELKGKSENELKAVLKNCFNELAKSQPETHHRLNALASIETVQREIAEKRLPDALLSAISGHFKRG